MNNNNENTLAQEKIGKPGFLRNASEIILHTVSAQKILLGNDKWLLGLKRFNQNITHSEARM